MSVEVLQKLVDSGVPLNHENAEQYAQHRLTYLDIYVPEYMGDMETVWHHFQELFVGCRGRGFIDVQLLRIFFLYMYFSVLMEAKYGREIPTVDALIEFYNEYCPNQQTSREEMREMSRFQAIDFVYRIWTE